MSILQYRHEDTLLGTEIDDLLLQARGLELVRDLLAARGASQAEVDAHTDELERVRNQLIGMIQGGTSDHAFGEAA
jgi:hypothetical protein